MNNPKDILGLFPPKSKWIYVSYVSTRGGSGKTTCTALSGLYNRSKSIPTILIDTDRDGALTSIMLPSERLRQRISSVDKSIRPSLFDVIDTYQAGGDFAAKFQEALITSDAFPDDQNLLILPSDHRMKNVDVDGDLATAFCAMINRLEGACLEALGPRIVIIDPSNHSKSIEMALQALANRGVGGSFVVFPTQRYAIRATMGTAKMVTDNHVRMLGFIPIRYAATQQYRDFIDSIRGRGRTVLTGIQQSAKLQQPTHAWAITSRFPPEFSFAANEMVRALLPDLPAEPPPFINPVKTHAKNQESDEVS